MFFIYFCSRILLLSKELSMKFTIFESAEFIVLTIFPLKFMKAMKSILQWYASDPFLLVILMYQIEFFLINRRMTLFRSNLKAINVIWQRLPENNLLKWTKKHRLLFTGKVHGHQCQLYHQHYHLNPPSYMNHGEDKIFDIDNYSLLLIPLFAWWWAIKIKLLYLIKAKNLPKRNNNPSHWNTPIQHHQKF